MRTGRILVRAGWAAFIILCGFSIYSLYRGYQDAGLSLPLVLAALAAWGISFVMVIGNELSGRGGADLSFFRWPKFLLIVGQLVASIFIAAYAHWIEHGAALAYTWAPKKCYHLLHGFIATDWFAIPLSIPVWIIWTLIVLVLASCVNVIIGAIFGSDSSIARWAYETFGGIRVIGGPDSDGS
jgi:hypothetical protein